MRRTVLPLICGAALAFAQPPPAVGAEREHDRIAIGKAIASLNDPLQRSNVFTQHGDGPARYAELRKSRPATAFRIVAPSEESEDIDGPTLTISHEPWGEAQINLPPPWRPGVIFTSADTALAEGACTYEEADRTPQRERLRFVMKKEGGLWKIASLRVLAP